jgi:DNA modification methylase
MEIYKKVYSSSRQEGQKEICNVHPTMKPINLICDKLKISSNENSIVLDLFGGSGSTLIACEQLNRKCYMMELDPHYIDVIIQRWENFTGEKAVLIERKENE